MDQSRVTMAVFLVAERNRAERHGAENVSLPQVAAYYRGMRDALNLAIAWTAGLEGFLRREFFEDALAAAGHIRPEAAAAAGPDDDEDEDEPAATPDPETGLVYDPDSDTRYRYHQAELDTQAAQDMAAHLDGRTDPARAAAYLDEPMGSWEPRS